jgi:hypothetical protein
VSSSKIRFCARKTIIPKTLGPKMFPRGISEPQKFSSVTIAIPEAQGIE